MTVGFHAPHPRARTGVAAYSAALLEGLRELGRVERGASHADVHLYHLGNNQLHRTIYQRALELPGVAVVHDAVLMHFFLGQLPRQAFLDEFVFNYGEWARELAARLWEGRARSAQDPRYFEYPMLRRIAERSRALIVHNPGAASRVSAHAPAARVFEIPHLFVAPCLPAASEVARFRQEMGIAGRTFLFGLFGHLRESKRVLPVLRAFQAVRAAGAGVALLVAGEFSSADLARAAAPLLQSPGVVRVGYTPERKFWRLAATVDAGINLRYPAAGETSGITIRLMGIGKPVIMSAGEETARFPAEACLKVDPGPGEEEMLAAYMRWLAASPEAARQLGRRAREHIHTHHGLDRVSRQYWEVLRASVE